MERAGNGAVVYLRVQRDFRLHRHEKHAVVLKGGFVRVGGEVVDWGGKRHVEGLVFLNNFPQSVEDLELPDTVDAPEELPDTPASTADPPLPTTSVWGVPFKV